MQATVHGIAKSRTRLSDFTFTFFIDRMGFPGGPVVKNLPAVQETQVRSLGQEDPLEKKMVTHSSILACRILWAEEKSLAGYSLLGHKESDTTD